MFITAKKIYAVRRGRKPGLYQTWDACKAQVNGFTGAEFKGFLNKDDALTYLSATSSGTSESSKEEASCLPDTDRRLEKMAVAYVDGSYCVKTQQYSCGAVLFYKDEKIEFSQKASDPQLKEMRNVAGEILGAQVVIAYCIEYGIPALEIHHDYEGVAKWALGEWKANKTGTKAYAKFCLAAKDQLSIRFVKVKGHSGNRYNDEADRLAKKALGIA